MVRASADSDASRAPTPIEMACENNAANLRTVSCQLADAVRKAHTTTSTAIAEQLNHLGGRSVRRRLYDSLKVLTAAGAISRNRRDKTLRWRGTAHLTMLGATRTRVIAKRACRDALVARIALARRNIRATDDGDVVMFPFVLVRAAQGACIALTASRDASALSFRIDSYFEVLNDAAVVTSIANLVAPLDLRRRRAVAPVGGGDPAQFAD